MDQSGTFNQMLKLIQLKVTKKWELSARNNLTSFSVLKLNTAKIILERLEIQTQACRKRGGRGTVAPPDFGRSEDAAGQRRCAALLHAPGPPDFQTLRHACRLHQIIVCQKLIGLYS